MTKINETIGKYGLMRLQHLKQNCPVFYHSMIVNNELSQHLIDIDQKASSEVKRILDELIKSNRPPDKEIDVENWVQHMNCLKHQAEELVAQNLLYT